MNKSTLVYRFRQPGTDVRLLALRGWAGSGRLSFRSFGKKWFNFSGDRKLACVYWWPSGEVSSVWPGSRTRTWLS